MLQSPSITGNSLQAQTGTVIRLHANTKTRTLIGDDLIREHLEHLLSSAQFDASARSREFLCFAVGEALAGRSRNLTQAAIAKAVFGRPNDFDAVLDPIVRVQAGRLRRSLERYYLVNTDTASIRIELPKGSYTPMFIPAEKKGGDPQRPGASHMPLQKDDWQWPAVLICQFTNESVLENNFVMRLQDELAMEMRRYGEVRVIREREADGVVSTSLRFELRGSVRSDQHSLVVDAYLIDRVNGEQLWSNEFHTDADGMRWNLDDIAHVIAARLSSEHGVIARVLAHELAVSRPEAAGACGVIARCHHFLFSRQASELMPSIEALQRLIAQAPEDAQGWTYLARLYLINYSFELSTLPTPIDKAVDYACQGVLLEPESAYGRCVLATALLVKGEMRTALDELEQAVSLNAGSLAYRELIGWLMALAGQWERGVALMRDTMTRNPYFLRSVSHGFWADYLRRGDFDAAYVAAIGHRDASSFWRELMMACCLGHLGRSREAQVYVAELLQARPQFVHRGRVLLGYYIKEPELRERVIDGLRKADLILR